MYIILWNLVLWNKIRGLVRFRGVPLKYDADAHRQNAPNWFLPRELNYFVAKSTMNELLANILQCPRATEHFIKNKTWSVVGQVQTKLLLAFTV